MGLCGRDAFADARHIELHSKGDSVYYHNMDVTFRVKSLIKTWPGLPNLYTTNLVPYSDFGHLAGLLFYSFWQEQHGWLVNRPTECK